MSEMTERMLRAMVATKQLEIDKQKRKIKELETKIKEMEDDYNSRLRDIEDRKKNKRTKPSNVSDK